jgi:hypothetical protein
VVVVGFFGGWLGVGGAVAGCWWGVGWVLVGRRLGVGRVLFSVKPATDARVLGVVCVDMSTWKRV